MALVVGVWAVQASVWGGTWTGTTTQDNVGIGTTAPPERLSVDGGGGTGNVMSITRDYTNATQGSRGGVILFSPAYGTGGQGNIITTNYWGDQNQGTLTLNAYNQTNQLVVHTLGNVGIGTTNPATKLFVSGALGTGGIGVNGTISGTYAANTAYLDNYLGESRVFSAGPDASTCGAFSVNGVNSTGTIFKTYLYATKTGNVGIGWTSPSAKLSLGGDYNGSALQKFLLFEDGLKHNFGMGMASAEMRTFYCDDSHWSLGTMSRSDGTTFSEKMRVDQYGNASVYGSQLVLNNSLGTGDAHIVINQSSNTGAQGGLAFMRSGINKRKFYTSQYNEGFYLYNFITGNNDVTFWSNGNVGINTGWAVDPGAKLAVAGDIKCTKLMINDWTIRPADFVFDPDHSLKKLSDVEKFVTTNKHLPGVPSGAEMKKQGVDVVKMNMALLEKVEELTLYAIQQNKLIEKQASLLEKQGSLLEKQNGRIEALERKMGE